MTYVSEQTSEELAAHIRHLQAMPGWHDPLADRLWREVEALRTQLSEQASISNDLAKEASDANEQIIELRKERDKLAEDKQGLLEDFGGLL